LTNLILDEENLKVKKGGPDIKYKGNTLDIIHGLNSHKNGYRELNHLVNLRSSSLEPVSGNSTNTLLNSRYIHKKDFNILPIRKKDKDFSPYMPHDKKSIICRKSIFIKDRNNPYDLPKYDSKLNDSNCNNMRHLMHKSQHMSTLKWEAGLRDY